MNTTLNASLGAILGSLREKRGLTLYGLSKKIEMRLETLKRIEKGEEVNSSALLKYLHEMIETFPEVDIIRLWLVGEPPEPRPTTNDFKRENEALKEELRDCKTRLENDFEGLKIEIREKLWAFEKELAKI